MKNISLSLLIVCAAFTLHAQYFYKDIIGTREINEMIKLYQANKVLQVEATGYDGDGVKNSDFSETHNFRLDQNLLKIATRDKTSINNEYYRFDSKGFLASVVDSIPSAVSSTTYQYDDKENPLIIKNSVSDASDSIYSTEVHQWFYNDAGKPVRMLRIVNDHDTTDVRFTLDEKGNVIEELPFINKVSREKTYYYYDDKNRLTDIVRFNIKAGRLLPDYMFEYSEANQVIQKITTLSAMGLGYLIWRYVYNEKGLKIKEASFNKDKVLTGKIEYIYKFAQ